MSFEPMFTPAKANTITDRRSVGAGDLLTALAQTQSIAKSTITAMTAARRIGISGSDMTLF